MGYKILDNDRFDYYVGGNFSCNAFLQFEHYPSITGIITVGPYAGCDAQLMKYAEEDFLKIFTLGNFLSLHNHQAILLELGYKLRASENFSLGLGFDFEYGRIAGRFCAQDKIYAISRTKNGSGKNDFGAAVELEIKKNGSWQYTKPVTLLTNAQTMSAGEEFTMALVSQSHVTQVGNHTCGVFSLSLERCLANGWKYSVSVQKVTDPEGNIPEGKGIVPAAENLILNPSVSQDLQFERAMELCK